MTFMARPITGGGARLVATLVAGAYTNIVTYVGYYSGLAGSLSRTALFGGTISELNDINGSTGLLIISGLSSNPLQAAFTTISITGSPSASKASSAASYSYSSNTATWSWSGAFGFISGNTYIVRIS